MPQADPGDLADRHLAPLVGRGVFPSLAWAVIRDSDLAMGGFGGASPSTISEIGSVTKVFTALLLADMAERAEVSLSDPAALADSGGTSPSPLDQAIFEALR